MNVDPWGYLHDELIWVRSGTGVSKSERNAYLTAERKGRSLPFPIVHPSALSAKSSKIMLPTNTTTGFALDTRACVLNLLHDYEEYMADGGLLDEDGVALLAYEYRERIAKHASLRARCVLVDEVQDCSTTQLAEGFSEAAATQARRGRHSRTRRAAQRKLPQHSPDPRCRLSDHRDLSIL